MSDATAIRLSGAGKMYKLFPSHLDNFLDTVGLARWLPWRAKPQEFWALRDVNLEVKRGRRLGIIGRNGAGKSTLLKLITGNLVPTEGRVEVHGQVQALLEAGAGFHPEFTGHENIRAALTLQGFTPEQIEAAIGDIAEFTELGPFLAQPLKAYSAGMQARLIFTTATAIHPDILVIDEILGAGDAYFAAKATERMRDLVSNGATVLLVSHALNSVVQFCEETIWIERGRIVKRGASLEVVNAYEGFIHAMDERRLQAKNRRLRQGGPTPLQPDSYGDTLVLTFLFQGETGAAADVARVQLVKDGRMEDEIRVGDVQDTTPGFSAFVALQGSLWSEPHQIGTDSHRSLAAGHDSQKAAIGHMVFYSYGLADDADYGLRIRYRCAPRSRLALTVTRNGVILYNQAELPAVRPDWTEYELTLADLRSGVAASVAPDVAPGDALPTAGNGHGGQAEITTMPLRSEKTMPAVRWASEGSLTIERVVTFGADGREQTVFAAGSPMTVALTILAHRGGHFEFVPSVTLQRLDGVFVSNFVGAAIPLDLRQGETRAFRMRIPQLLLGDGQFRFSSSIFEKGVDEGARYDLVVHACEFKVVGNRPWDADAVVQHPASEWVAAREINGVSMGAS